MFERIKIIKGRKYRYRESRTWENGRVRSRSQYLGPLMAARSGAVSSGLTGPTPSKAT